MTDPDERPENDSEAHAPEPSDARASEGFATPAEEPDPAELTELLGELERLQPEDFTTREELDDTEPDFDPEFDLDESECEHPYEAFLELDDGDGLGCGECGEHWHVEDPGAAELVAVVLASTATAIDETFERLSALERFVSDALGARTCVCCGQLVVDPSAAPTRGAALVGVEIVPDVWACPDHVAGASGHHDLGVEELDEHLALWVESEDLVGSSEPVQQWRLERLVAARPGLAEVLDDTEELSAAREVVVDLALATLLGVPERCSLRELGDATADLLDLPAPRSRVTRGFLLGLVAATDRVLRGDHRPDTGLEGAELDPRERIVRECHAEVALPSVASRDEVALELLGEMPASAVAPLVSGAEHALEPHGALSAPGDNADLPSARSLLHAITDRALTELLDRTARLG